MARRAKVKVEFDEKEFNLRVKQVFQKVKQSKQLQEEIGTFLSQRIRSEAKRGKPLNKNRSFPKLADSTVRQRKRLSELNVTTTPFRPAFSNLSITGQLLNSIKYVVVKDVVIIFFRGRRNPYTVNEQGKLQKLKKGVNARNVELAKILAEKGFVVFDSKTIKTDDKILKRIRNIVIRYLRRALRVAG